MQVAPSSINSAQYLNGQTSQRDNVNDTKSRAEAANPLVSKKAAKDSKNTDKPSTQLNSAALNKLPASKLNKLNPSQLAKLNPQQLNKLSPSQLNKLPSAQLNKLGVKSLLKLDSAQLAKLNAAQLAKLPDAKLKKLSPQILSKLSLAKRKQLDGVDSKNQVSDTVKNLKEKGVRVTISDEARNTIAKEKDGLESKQLHKATAQQAEKLVLSKKAKA